MPGTVEAFFFFFLTDLILSKSLGVGTIPILQMRRQAQGGEVICLQSPITGTSQESECLPLHGENSERWEIPWAEEIQTLLYSGNCWSGGGQGVEGHMVM